MSSRERDERPEQCESFKTLRRRGRPTHRMVDSERWTLCVCRTRDGKVGLAYPERDHWPQLTLTNEQAEELAATLAHFARHLSTHERLFDPRPFTGYRP